MSLKRCDKFRVSMGVLDKYEKWQVLCKYKVWQVMREHRYMCDKTKVEVASYMFILDVGVSTRSVHSVVVCQP